MPKLVLAAFCERVVIDQFSNSLSIINQLDELQLPRAKIEAELQALAKHKDRKRRLALPMRFALVSIWEREKPTIMESTEMTVRLVAPDGQVLLSFKNLVDLRKHRRWRNLLNITALPILGEGTYQFQIRIRTGVRWKLVHRVAYQLRFSDAPPTSVLGKRLH